ncbi:MAG: EF-P beta-lysylation protein EpmB [Legionellaceae bacterium]|nr:EF-P beta-lysylation protein EpmB [Legionellaceae bacterium]
MHWQQHLIQGFTSNQDLLNYLELPPDSSHDAALTFKTKVPLGFAARMQKGNRHDPLLIQVLADPQELESPTEYVQDPLSELDANPIPGLLHKYHGRVLLTLTQACAVHCRYCFRRHFPYADNNPKSNQWERVLQYIANDPSIYEVILSGGDPLMLADKTLLLFIEQLNHIAHVDILRFHTRLPIVLPERIDSSLLHTLQQSRPQVVFVMHCNHPQEIDEQVILACQRLREQNLPLYNQSVLLAGVNDNSDLLAMLSRRLFNIGVQPYYLHALDKVAGAHHFFVPEERAQAIYQQLHAKLPGYLLPKWVKEEPNTLGKTFLG